MEINLNNLKLSFTKIENSEDAWFTEGIKGCNEETFIKNNSAVAKSIFTQLDFNKDGYISEMEWGTAKGAAGDDGILSKQEIENSCMQQLKFSAKRDVDKLFKVDRNRDGFFSNVEMEAWKEYNENGKTLIGPMTNKDLEKRYNIKETVNENEMRIEDWLNLTIEELKTIAKESYGVELTESQIIEMKKEQIKQLNTWLFKTGDNKESSLYEQLNLDSYTRLMSTEDGVACCGGDICEIPEFHPSDLGELGRYTAQDMKARLKWAENSYQIDDNGNAVLDKNGNTIPIKIMTPEQVQKYKKIVESETGVPWFSADWEITIEQWRNIGSKVNGTFEDEKLLKGKKRSDISENRQALLRFLEEKGWLYEQFK